MKIPILQKLKDEEKFDFAVFANNYEQTEDYWSWWWENKATPGEMSWPEIISNDDPILEPTVNKVTADLCANREFFDRTLFNMTQVGAIPIRDAMPRETFRKIITRIAANASVVLPSKPQMVITGGGYGSGKTTAINFLGERGVLPVGMPHLVGADIFKQLIPEYNLIKAIGDGRANSVVHDECIALSDNLIDQLIEHGRSFVWDSSMSNKGETLRRIVMAQKHQYDLTMVAVLTPVEVALSQAIKRARDSRRFPPADLILKSHVLFIQAFRDYIQYFDEVIVFANLGDGSDTVVVAEKKSGKELEILVPDIFNSPLFVPPSTA